MPPAMTRHDRPENRRSETGLEGAELVRSPDENVVDRRDATPHLVRCEQLDERLLTTTLTLSNTPLEQHQSEKPEPARGPKTMVATPNPVTHPSSVRPAWRIGGR
jgi:hypothetical protein